jgi:NADP-dependent 3-hydroxy acid dehydrogenase YdfG
MLDREREATAGALAAQGAAAAAMARQRDPLESLSVKIPERGGTASSSKLISATKSEHGGPG